MIDKNDRKGSAEDSVVQEERMGLLLSKVRWESEDQRMLRFAAVAIPKLGYRRIRSSGATHHELQLRR